MKIWLLSCLMLANLALAEKDAVQMGPGDCVSTWRSDVSSHCMVKTQCSEYATKLASYQLRLVCVGHDGGRILHSFQEGGFDTQETFDTNIACQRCESGDNLVTATPTSLASHTDAGVTALEAVNASEVHGLEEEVKQLKSSMINMAKVVTQLKLQVDSQSTESQHLRGAVAPHVAMASAVAPHVPSHQSQQNAPQVINASVVLASASGTTSPKVTPAGPPAPPLSVQGSLSKAAAMPASRKAHGTSFLGMAMNSSAFKASVDSAGREAEAAALEAEKEAETLAAAVTSDSVPGGIEHVLNDALAEVH
eukprot:symbB.v1.2.000071.t1/scaffold2.1/size812218/25